MIEWMNKIRICSTSYWMNDGMHELVYKWMELHFIDLCINTFWKKFFSYTNDRMNRIIDMICSTNDWINEWMHWIFSDFDTSKCVKRVISLTQTIEWMSERLHEITHDL